MANSNVAQVDEQPATIRRKKRIPAWVYIVGGLFVVPSLMSMWTTKSQSPTVALLSMVVGWGLFVLLVWRHKRLRTVVIVLLVAILVAVLLLDAASMSFMSFLHAETVTGK